jgi:rRNA maturation RNase YbeY
MTDLQAAVGLVQLRRIDEMVRDRRERAERYRQLLSGVHGLLTAADPPYGTTNYQSFWVLLPEGSRPRNEVMAALVAEGIGQAEIGILLVDDKRIAKVHAEWLGDPTPTDVITFDLSAAGPGGGAGSPLCGDIVVSTETARRMSREFGWMPRQEVAYYVIHGLLHLSGFDDISEPDAKKMAATQQEILKLVLSEVR